MLRTSTLGILILSKAVPNFIFAKTFFIFKNLATVIVANTVPNLNFNLKRNKTFFVATLLLTTIVPKYSKI